MSIWRNTPQSLINNNNIYLVSFRINFNDEWIIVPATLLTPSFIASQMLCYLQCLVASNFSLKMLFISGSSRFSFSFFFSSPLFPSSSCFLSICWVCISATLRGAHTPWWGPESGEGWDRQRKTRGHKQSQTTFLYPIAGEMMGTLHVNHLLSLFLF